MVMIRRDVDGVINVSMCMHNFVWTNYGAAPEVSITDPHIKGGLSHCLGLGSPKNCPENLANARPTSHKLARKARNKRGPIAP